MGFSGYPSASTPLSAADLFILEQGGSTRKVTREDLVAALLSLLPDGTAAAPALAFETDPNTGLYRVGVDQLGISAGGVRRALVDANGVEIAGGARVADGSVGTPAVRFTSDPDTGVYRVGTNQVGVATGGSRRVLVDSNGVEVSTGGLRVEDGSAASPAVRFTDDPNTGLYRIAADVLALVAGGTARAKVANAAPYLTVNDGSDREVWHEGNVDVTTNADGTSLRLPNGIQVCWARKAPSIAVSNASTKGGFLSDEQVWNFPQAFNADPFLFISIEATAGVAGNMDRFSTSSARWRMRAITSQAASTTPVYLLAFGTYA